MRLLNIRSGWCVGFTKGGRCENAETCFALSGRDVGACAAGAYGGDLSAFLADYFSEG